MQWLFFVLAGLMFSNAACSYLDLPTIISHNYHRYQRNAALAPVPSVSGTCENFPTLRLRGGFNMPGKERFTKKEREILKSLSSSLVYSEADPGPWKEKITSHTPVSVLNAENGTIQVSLPHAMDDETEEKPLHYIEFIWILSDHGEVLDIHAFQPTDPAPVAIFEISESGRNLSGKTVVPYAMCNLHGVWRGAPIVVP